MAEIAPLAQRLAEENNVDWAMLQGSGENGRIVERDVLDYLSKVMMGEADLNPTPEPTPEGMEAWPEEDVLAYQEEQGTAPVEEVDSSLDADFMSDALLTDDTVSTDAGGSVADDIAAVSEDVVIPDIADQVDVPDVALAEDDVPMAPPVEPLVSSEPVEAVASGTPAVDTAALDAVKAELEEVKVKYNSTLAQLQDVTAKFEQAQAQVQQQAQQLAGVQQQSQQLAALQKQASDAQAMAQQKSTQLEQAQTQMQQFQAAASQATQNNQELDELRRRVQFLNSEIARRDQEEANKKRRWWSRG